MKSFKPAYILILLFLSACSPVKFLAVPIDYDPKLYFKPDTTTIVLINQFDISKIKSATKRKLESIKSGVFTSLKYAQTQLSQLPHVKVISLVDSATLKVNTDSVKTLALRYHSDYVLALKNFDAGIGLDDMQSSTAYYSSTVIVTYRLYEGNGIYSKKLEGIDKEAQSEQPNLGLIGNLLLHPTVGGNKESINLVTEHATQIALQDYFPYTITNNRPLYYDAFLQPMVEEIMANHFDKAYALAEPLLKDADPKKASKAAYNLAVVYEAQGDIDLALNMAQFSSDKNQNRMATKLLADLQGE